MVEDGGNRLYRLAAFAVVATVIIAGLYYGQEILIPVAIAILFAFLLGPIVTWARRAMPLPLAVTIVVLATLVVVGLLATLIASQLADVAASVADYQSNILRKVQEIKHLSEGNGVISRLASMVSALGNELGQGHEAGAASPALRVQNGGSAFETVSMFVAPLLHPIVTIGVVVILVAFILLHRAQLADKFVRLFGSSDVHATSSALEDAATRIGRVLFLQLATNFAFAVVIAGGLFAFGMPNAILWGLLGGALRFVPYAGAILGAILPTLIAVAIAPDWWLPVVVLGWIVFWDQVIGQIVEPLLFGDSTGVTPLALLLSAIFWAMMWGPVGLLLATPLTICLLVVGRHVPSLAFLEVLLGDEPALLPYQQIYHRLIRHAIADAVTVALAEIEEKGREEGLDAGMGRMVSLAEADRALDRLDARQVQAIVDGTEEMLDALQMDLHENDEELPGTVDGPVAVSDADSAFICLGGRGQIDNAAAALVAFALNERGLPATVRTVAGSSEAGGATAGAALLCYASMPSIGVRRYASRKLARAGWTSIRHAVLSHDKPATIAPVAAESDLFVGDLKALCGAIAQYAASSHLGQERPGG